MAWTSAVVYRGSGSGSGQARAATNTAAGVHPGRIQGRAHIPGRAGLHPGAAKVSPFQTMANEASMVASARGRRGRGGRLSQRSWTDRHVPIWQLPNAVIVTIQYKGLSGLRR